jgi:hypothetical protein
MVYGFIKKPQLPSPLYLGLMQPTRGLIGRQLAARFLGRIGEALAFVFIINILFGLFPLQLTSPGWQERVAFLLRTLAVYPLLAAALIFLCENQAKSLSPPIFPLRRIQKLAPLAAIGFVLIIPLQTNSAYTQIRNSDNEAQKTIRQVERRVTEFTAISSLSELQQITQNLPPGVRPAPSIPLIEARALLVDRGESELARLRILSNRAKSDTIKRAVPDLIRDGLICLVYAIAFYGLRHINSSVIGPSAIDPEMDD